MYGPFLAAATRLNTFFANEKQYTKGLLGHAITVSMDAGNTRQEAVLSVIDAYSRGELIFFRREHPQLIGRGSYQVIFDLGLGFVAKMGYESGEEFHDLPEYDMLITSYVPSSVDRMRDMGFPVPPAAFVRVGWVGGTPGTVSDPEILANTVCITTDLRSGSRYFVKEYDPSIAETLPNGTELIDKKEHFSERLRALDHHASLHVTFNRHLLGTLEEAIDKAFLLQVPRQNGLPGKLVMGDFDHIFIKPLTGDYS
jgi:hypothetical protein